jgi:hypothetical protein
MKLESGVKLEKKAKMWYNRLTMELTKEKCFERK